MTDMAKHDDADPLRSVPPRYFVRARNALAEEVARKGKAAEARRIRRLPRPNPVVWALNTVANRSRAVPELADAAEQLRGAQLGEGDLRAATGRYRGALEPLVRAATERLREAGIRVSATLERRLQSTLLAAVTDRGLRADLAAGRLAEEHAAPGFDVLTQGPIPATFLRPRPTREEAGRAPTPRRSPAARTAEPETERARSGPAEHRRAESEREARRAIRQAQRRVRALDEAARRKERAADAADRKLETTRTALREQERQAALLRTSAREAREMHRTALDEARKPRA